MNYLKIFRQNLNALLEGLPEEARKTAVDFAVDAVLESYKNGKEGKTGKKKEPAEAKA